MTNVSPPDTLTPGRSGPSSVRSLLSGTGLTVIPGAGTALEARLIEASGAPAIYLSGYAFAGACGLPDIGLIGAAEVIANAAAIRQVTSLPLIVDADTGYGDVNNVRRTVQMLERAGAGAVQIEDQVWPKRCGHMAGKEVIAADVMVRKVTAAAAARQDPETVIIARTDARAVFGLPEALDRARRYADAGADMVFVDAPHSLAELESIGTADLGAPLLANMSESGLTPIVTAADLESMGFRIAIYPTAAMRVAVHAASAFLAHLLTSGDSISWAGGMVTLAEFNSLVGLPEELAFSQVHRDRSGKTSEQGG